MKHRRVSEMKILMPRTGYVLRQQNDAGPQSVIHSLHVERRRPPGIAATVDRAKQRMIGREVLKDPSAISEEALEGLAKRQREACTALVRVTDDGPAGVDVLPQPVPPSGVEIERRRPADEQDRCVEKVVQGSAGADDLPFIDAFMPLAEPTCQKMQIAIVVVPPVVVAVLEFVEKDRSPTVRQEQQGERGIGSVPRLGIDRVDACAVPVRRADVLAPPGDAKALQPEELVWPSDENRTFAQPRHTALRRPQGAIKPHPMRPSRRHAEQCTVARFAFREQLRQRHVQRVDPGRRHRHGAAPGIGVGPTPVVALVA